MRFTPGDRVTVRGQRWLVEATAAFAQATLVSLVSTEPGAAPCRRTLVSPFDRPVVAPDTPRLRTVTPRRWGHLLRAQVSAQRIHGELTAARTAKIDLLPFQLEPALALVQGRASRFLLADEVGLGKTIQAGLMLAELRHRSWCDHALVIAPAGLRQQWADELNARFDIRSLVLNAAALSRLSGSLPHGVNPWTIEPVVITSIDFIKQTEVLHALAAELWDIVIVDEAHQASLSSLRYEAVQAMGARARHLVLVTATPHAGNDHAFRGLCALGRLDESEAMLLFRRTREQAGLPRRRRAHLLAVRQTAAALEMHRRLDAYLFTLWSIARRTGRHDATLVATVLGKRAFSSAHSLVRSLERRLAALTGFDAHADAPSQQASLPFDCDIDDSDDPVVPGAPAFDRAEDERKILERLLEAARRASADERKLRALLRLVRRVREPIIVFTEYRDTLEAIRSAVGHLRRTTLLHGGQTAQERRESISAFTTGGADLLLATDAGSEGLNLQPHCRIVVNLELPWSPTRLEQRIGRVDRIGQTRTVHAINLLAAGTAESQVLAALLRRLDRIRLSEIEIAACVIGRSEPARRAAVQSPETITAELGTDATREACRIAQARTVLDNVAAGVAGRFVPVSTITFRRPASLRCTWHRHVIALLRVRIVSGAGRLVEDTLVVLAVPFDAPWRRPARRQVQEMAWTLVEHLRPALVATARRLTREREEQLARASADWAVRAAEREHHLARRASPSDGSLVQAALFDSRTLKSAVERQRHERAARLASEARLERLTADRARLLRHGPDIALLLFTC